MFLILSEQAHALTTETLKALFYRGGDGYKLTESGLGGKKEKENKATAMPQVSKGITDAKWR